MDYAHKLYRALGIDPDEKGADREFASEADIPVGRLRHYNDKNILPSGEDLTRICREAGVSPLKLRLKIGRLDRNTIEALQDNAEAVHEIIGDEATSSSEVGGAESIEPCFTTDFGTLYQGDCMDLLPNIDSEQVDLVFADPPFNLDKEYPSRIDDNLKESEYLEWCEEWLAECVRVLKPGGSLFLWNLPKWNTHLSNYLNSRLTFRHWITVDIKYRLPIRGRLYPSHYSLLYYCKGERPDTFSPDRLPIETCPECYTELKDYGGYKSKMNPEGVNLTDVWYDIPPVRHSKYKKRDGVNELSIKLMDRIIEMSSSEGDLVLDPFGGGGTTYVVAEMKKRNWMGIEIGPVDVIKDRLTDYSDEKEYLAEIRNGYNALFTDGVKDERKKRDMWTQDTYHSDNGSGTSKSKDKKAKADSQKEIEFE